MLSWPGHDTFRSGTLTDLAAQDLNGSGSCHDLSETDPRRVIRQGRGHRSTRMPRNFIAIVAVSACSRPFGLRCQRRCLAAARAAIPASSMFEGPNQFVDAGPAPATNRIDSFSQQSSRGRALLQLIFFVPGIDEDAGASAGRGSLTTEPDLLATMMEFGKLPRRGAAHRGAGSLFPTAAKPWMRSRLWSAGQPASSAPTFPSIAESDPRPDQPRRAGAARCRGPARYENAALV